MFFCATTCQKKRRWGEGWVGGVRYQKLQKLKMTLQISLNTIDVFPSQVLPYLCQQLHKKHAVG